jgi:hypothetical protein
LGALGVLVLRTLEHAHLLAHFIRGLLIVMAEKRIAIEISYPYTRSFVTFSGVLYYDNRERFFSYDTKEKEYQNIRQYLIHARTNQIALCFEAVFIKQNLSWKYL